MNCNINTRIHYMVEPDDGEKLLPFQYYNLYNLVTIPILANDKRPFIKEWNKTKKTIHPSDINQNIGILTGKNPNKITVLDIDTADGGMFHFKLIMKQYKEIITPIVKSPNGGIHIFFKYNKKIPTMYRIKVNGKKIGWDVKSDNGVVITEPSIIDGNKYKWVKDRSLNDVEIISMPIWLEKYILDHMK